MLIYSNDFYNNNVRGSYESAEEIIPLIVNLLKPKSIVDVGCGSGSWLKCIQQYGIKNYLGIDNFNINRQIKLQINKKKFLHHNLENPLQINRKFDVVLSLEVAEHLSPDSALIYIKTLVSLGYVIIFSAAIPHQTGTHHVNEQWPSYWAKLFSEHGYIPYDYFREKIWNNERIEWWYTQNLLIFIKKSYMQSNRELQQRLGKSIKVPAPRIHPLNCISKKHTNIIKLSTRRLLNRLGSYL